MASFMKDVESKFTGGLDDVAERADDVLETATKAPGMIGTMAKGADSVLHRLDPHLDDDAGPSRLNNGGNASSATKDEKETAPQAHEMSNNEPSKSDEAKASAALGAGVSADKAHEDSVDGASGKFAAQTLDWKPGEHPGPIVGTLEGAPRSQIQGQDEPVLSADSKDAAHDAAAFGDALQERNSGPELG